MRCSSALCLHVLHAYQHHDAALHLLSQRVALMKSVPGETAAAAASAATLEPSGARAGKPGNISWMCEFWVLRSRLQQQAHSISLSLSHTHVIHFHSSPLPPSTVLSARLALGIKLIVSCCVLWCGSAVLRMIRKRPAAPAVTCSVLQRKACSRSRWWDSSSGQGGQGAAWGERSCGSQT